MLKLHNYGKYIKSYLDRLCREGPQKWITCRKTGTSMHLNNPRTIKSITRNKLALLAMSTSISALRTTILPTIMAKFKSLVGKQSTIEALQR